MTFALLMVLAGAIYRLVPHQMNVAPVAALALIGGMYFGRRYALWLPLTILATSDLVLNAQMHYPLLYVPRVIDYVAFAAVGLLGMWVRSPPGGLKIAGAAATPIFLFLLRNFRVWLFRLYLTYEGVPKPL